MQQRNPLRIDQSKLYRIGRKKDLAELFGITIRELKLLSRDDNFKEWFKKQKGKKPRKIEEPLPQLAHTLKHLHTIINRIGCPPYLMSGKKFVKPRDNAEIHRTNKYMITVDIESFFQSTKREFVYLFLKNDFGQSNDVASLLADLVTYKWHIPTGTSTSQDMAFWAYKKTFDRIYKLCQNKEITMTIWVDDICFSSLKPFPKGWVNDIQNIFCEVDLTLKISKTKRYGANMYKLVTGSAISPGGEIRVKNSKRQEIRNWILGKKVEDLSLTESRKFMGKLTSQRQNEPHFFESVYSRCKSHLRKLDREKSLNNSKAKLLKKSQPNQC